MVKRAGNPDAHDAPIGTRTAADAGRFREGTRTPFGPAFASLAYRNFVWLWLGQITHSGALWMDMIARPLLILNLTGSPVHLGLVMAVRTVPAVAFGVVAGVVADSFNRRQVLLITKVIVFFLGTAFALLIVTGRLELWHIYLFTFLRGTTMAFDQPARRAMVPSIVPRHLVTNAMALSTGSMNVMRIAGAAGAGLIIAFSGIDMAYVTIAAFYAAAVFFTWKLTLADHSGGGYEGVEKMRRDLIRGLRFGWNDSTVRGIIIVSVGYFMFGMAFMQVFAPLFARQVLEIGDSGFGYMMSVTGLGGVAGALALATINPRRNRGLLVTGLLAVFGLLLVLFSASTYVGSVLATFIVAGFLGAGQSSFFPVVNAVLLDAAPENIRGRVLGLLSFDRAMTTLGGAIAGLLSAAIGAQVAQIIFGLCCIAMALAMYSFYPALRRID